MTRALVATLLLLVAPLAHASPQEVCGAPSSPSELPLSAEAGEVTCEDQFGWRDVKYATVGVADAAEASAFVERGQHTWPTSGPGNVTEESRSVAVVVGVGAQDAGVRAGTFERTWTPDAGGERCDWTAFVALVAPVVTEHVLASPPLACNGVHRLDERLLP